MLVRSDSYGLLWFGSSVPFLCLGPDDNVMLICNRQQEGGSLFVVMLILCGQAYVMFAFCRLGFWYVLLAIFEK